MQCSLSSVSAQGCPPQGQETPSLPLPLRRVHLLRHLRQRDQQSQARDLPEMAQVRVSVPPCRQWGRD